MKLAAVAALVSFVVGAAPGKVAVGNATYGLAQSGGSVWAGTLDSGDLVRIDPRSGKVTKRINIGARVFNLVAAPGAVWAVDNALGAAVRLDTRTLKTTRVTVGLGPYDLEWGFGSIWVANSSEGSVWRITGTKVVKKIKVGVEPNGLTAYRGALWVSDHTLGKVVRVDPRTNRVTGTVAVAGADWIVGDGGSLLVSQETNRVAKIDIASLKVTGSVATARNPLGGALAGGKLWVPCIDGGEVDVIDPATMRVVDRKRSPGGPIVALPAFGHVYVSHSTGTAITRY